jgi:hypothetical protein
MSGNGKASQFETRRNEQQTGLQRGRNGSKVGRPEERMASFFGRISSVTFWLSVNRGKRKEGEGVRKA